MRAAVRRPSVRPSRCNFPGRLRASASTNRCGSLIDDLVSGLIEGTLASAREAAVESVEEVRAYPRRLAALTAETAETNSALKRFLHRKVYASEPLVEDRRRSMGRIADLFQFFLETRTACPIPMPVWPRPSLPTAWSATTSRA